MNFNQLMSKMKGSLKKSAKTREERDFIQRLEDNKRNALDIVKRCADELEEIGYFLQPLIALDDDTRVSHSSGMSCRASLEITPMSFEVYKDLKSEKDENAARLGLICEEEQCGKPHETCPHPVKQSECKLGNVEQCGKCLTWTRDEVKKLEKKKAEDAAAGEKEAT